MEKIHEVLELKTFNLSRVFDVMAADSGSFRN